MSSDPPAEDAASGETAVASQRPWEQVLRLSLENRPQELISRLDELSTADQALVLSRLDERQRQQVLEALPPDGAAEWIQNLNEAQAADVIGTLEASTAAAIVHSLPSDDQADVLGDLSAEQAEAILDALPQDEALAVRELTSFADDVAGGLMIREVLRFDVQMTVAEVIEQLLANEEEYRDLDVWYGYVCDGTGRLIGVLPMRNLLFVNRSAAVRDVMIADPLALPETAPLEELVEFFDTHAFLGVPVVDSRGILKGVVHREAVDHESVRAAESDYLKSQGIVGGEELRTMPVWLRARRRLSWLSINVLLNIGAAAVIALFQDTLQAVIALAVFLPIISDMSGCSGNQAVAVTMRELSMGLIRPAELLRVWGQELSVGLINGTALGALVAAVAVVFKGNPYLGVVVGVALFANTIIAVSIGGTVPMVLKRFGFDPAVASGPLLTTVTDMCGFFLVLGLATMMLAQLT
ncbi:magnesium transporter [Roseimaritima sediminicola]|uniref:magnesium transporter n=1 Tax=Roseimaritima sediminicola TaxID=2662066 RepID=UPI0012984D00|nr:magnesium transporter [Roseimaritima sediminicola]